jgi:uncharacterized protein (DUF983 family)
MASLLFPALFLFIINYIIVHQLFLSPIFQGLSVPRWVELVLTTTLTLSLLLLPLQNGPRLLFQP